MHIKISNNSLTSKYEKKKQQQQQKKGYKKKSSWKVLKWFSSRKRKKRQYGCEWYKNVSERRSKVWLSIEILWNSLKLHAIAFQTTSKIFFTLDKTSNLFGL